MAEPKFKEVTINDILRVAAFMREQDKEEVRAATNSSPVEALIESLEVSNYSSTFLINDEPSAIFGLRIIDPSTGIGVPWMLGTDNLTRHAKSWLPYSKLVIDEMKKITPRLYNLVHAKNKVSIRWLTWLGANVDKQTEFRLHNKNEVFYKFTMGDWDV